MKSYNDIKLFSNFTYYILALLLTPIQISYSHAQQNNCILIDPVSDMASSFPAPDNPTASPDTGQVRRAHQGLYNDQGYCSQETEDQINISYPDMIYGYHAATKEALHNFWTRKNHIRWLNQLPHYILENVPNAHYAQEPTIVLTWPWNNFSIGTRFKHMPEQDHQNSYAITRIDYATQSVVFDLIPKQYAIPEIKHNPQGTRKLFVNIINDFVTRVTQSGKNNVSPYIWGGSSFIKPYKDSAFYKKDGTWQRDGNHNPYSGYDCSEFVMRMAKIAGIDFPWKTSAIIGSSLQPLGSDQQLEDGDIIWVPGHVMIVSSIERNELIESRGYDSGYGCLHRIPLNECFEEVSNYDDLLQKYHNHETIKFKNKSGAVVDKTYTLKLLKLIS